MNSYGLVFLLSFEYKIYINFFICYVPDKCEWYAYSKVLYDDYAIVYVILLIAYNWCRFSYILLSKEGIFFVSYVLINVTICNNGQYYVTLVVCGNYFCRDDALI